MCDSVDTLNWHTNKYLSVSALMVFSTYPRPYLTCLVVHFSNYQRHGVWNVSPNDFERFREGSKGARSGGNRGLDAAAAAEVVVPASAAVASWRASDEDSSKDAEVGRGGL